MYIIKKTNTISNIIYMEYDDKSYEIKNIINPSYHINNICVYDTKFVSKVHNQLMPFDYMFNDLTTLIFNYLYNNSDEDDDGSGVDILLGELDRIKATLESQYKEFMKRQEYYMYLDKITFLKDELVSRREINKYRQNINQIITGRAR